MSDLNNVIFSLRCTASLAANFHFATLRQSAVLGAFKCQSVLASPKINRKKFYGLNAIYRNEFGDFPSVFGSI